MNWKITAIIAIIMLIISAGWLSLNEVNRHFESIELRINWSYQDGFNLGQYEGYYQGIIDITNTAYQQGFAAIPIDENTTANLYSPQGCVDAIREAGNA